MLKVVLFMGLLTTFGSGVSAAEDLRQLKVESSSKLNVQNQIVTFLEKLIESDPAVQKQYWQYLTKDDEGNTFGIGDFQVIEWEVVKATDDSLEKRERSMTQV